MSARQQAPEPTVTQPAVDAAPTAPTHAGETVDTNIRFAALTASIAILASGGRNVDVSDALALARRIEAWVTRC
jgi:hypothetical protein